MFTGIVEEIGTIREATPYRLLIEAKKVLEGTRVGDSMAVNGVCLTVTSQSDSTFGVDIMPETLRRSNLGSLCNGDGVNVERALEFGGRLGGHLVLGHVDDVGTVVMLTHEEYARVMRISASARLMLYIAEKGFIAVDGVSLTVVDLNQYSFDVSLVAYTLEHTTLGARRPGDVVNLEADVIAKYLQRLKEGPREGLTLSFLQEYGFA
jgi:riboflavin synthase